MLYSFAHKTGNCSVLILCIFVTCVLHLNPACAQSIHSPEALDDMELKELIPLLDSAGELDYPINSIRISNCFIRKGKSESLAAINSFLEEAEPSQLPERNLVILLPILFPMEKQNAFPSEDFVNLADQKWSGPFGETYVVGGVPLDFRGAYGGAGPGNAQIREVLDWARQHGVFRDTELEPVSNLARLVADIEQSGIFAKACDSRENGKNLMRKLIRWQIYSAVTHDHDNIGDIEYSKGGPWGQVLAAGTLLEPEAWENFLRASSSMQWNSLTRSYQGEKNVEGDMQTLKLHDRDKNWAENFRRGQPWKLP